MKKKFSGFFRAGVLALAICAGLTGCGSGGQKTETTETEEQEAVLPEDQELVNDYTSVENLETPSGTYIAVVVKGLAENTYWDMIRQGVEAAVKDANEQQDYSGDRAIRLTFEGPAEESNEEEQINTLDTVLADNPDVLCLAAIDVESCQPQLETAWDNGIPVLVLDAGVKSDLVRAVCQTDNFAAGKAAAEKLCEGIGESGKVALIRHSAVTETSILRGEGFQAELEKHTGVELVCELQQNPDMPLEEMLLQLKENYPDLKGIFSTNESTTDAVLELYRDEENIPVIVGFDNGEEQIQAIRDGLEYGCICQNPYSMGYAVVVAALHAVNDEEIDPVIDSGYKWIDRSNIDDEENQIYLYK